MSTALNRCAWFAAAAEIERLAIRFRCLARYRRLIWSLRRGHQARLSERASRALRHLQSRNKDRRPDCDPAGFNR